MVSLLSLFGGKKKSRRAPSPPGEHTNEKKSPKARPSSRFLSLRVKNSSRPYDIADRRTSSDLQRRRSHRQSKTPPSELPRLALSWEDLGDEGSGAASLGLEGVGRPPELKKAEIEALQKRQYACEEVMQGWKWFGKALKDTGLETRGIMVGRSGQRSTARQNLLIALFLLSIHPELVNSFPSLNNHYPSALSSSKDPGAPWIDRLQSAISSTSDPFVFAEALKHLARRLRTGESTSQGILDVGIYNAFAKAEHAASHPPDAYETIFVPRLRLGLAAYFEEIFEVWSAVAAHADSNGLPAGKICLLLGSWIMGGGVTGNTWQDVYDGYISSARMVEHLFFAWIRNQSVKQQLPTRLLQLIEAYPYSDTPSIPPSLPTSSFTRRTLHITATAPRSDIGRLRPADILRESLLAGKSKHLPIARLLCERASQAGHGGSLQGVIARPSLTILGLDEDDLTPSRGTGLIAEPSQEDGPLYRPFSGISSDDASQSSFRRRSQSHGNIDTIRLSPATSPINGSLSPPSPDPVSPPAPLRKQNSFGMLTLDTPRDDAAWESFSKAGFGDTPKTDFSLSPRLTPSSPLPSMSPNAIANGSGRPFFGDSGAKGVLAVALSVIEEEAVELDDMFMPFVEDGQSDTAILRKWPVFTLVRLADNLFGPEHSAIEWLLITVTPQPPPTPEQTPIGRPTSPAVSTMSKSGSSFNIFKRSASYNAKTGPRRSLFGASRSPKALSSRNLPTLAETGASGSNLVEPLPAPIGQPDSAMTSAPTDYTVTEMGEMIKVSPSAANFEEVLGPSDDCKVSEWVYRAEGRAHIIFAYRGSSPTYFGRVLRIRKPNVPAEDDEEPGKTWREKLLPELISPALLLTPKDVVLDAKWAKALFEKADKSRPVSRKVESGSITDFLKDKREVKATVMEDLIYNMPGKDERVLCIEIKPKWGFLPAAENVAPLEAAKIKSRISRYRLHQHLKDPNKDLDDQYDPLDLYSDDGNRVTSAIAALWGIWTDTEGSKSSFRVYVDGKMIHPKEAGFIPGISSSGSLAERTAPLVLPVLRESGILPVLRDLQANLDRFDISTLAARFRDEHPDRALFDETIASSPSLPELIAVVDKYKGPRAHADAAADWTLRESLIAYMLSAIFKDCSIFLRIPLASGPEGYHALKPGATAKIIDLDLKSMSSLKKWYDLDEQIWRHWLDTHPPLEEQAESHRDSNGLAPLTAHDNASTRAIHNRTPDISNHAIPARPSATGSSLRPAASIEGLSIADALGLSPSRNTFGKRDDEDGHELRAASADAIDQKPSTAKTSEIDDSITQTPTTWSIIQEGPASAEESSHIDPIDVNANETAHKDSLDTARLRTDSTLTDRRERSLAPSPSPRPQHADLPSVEDDADAGGTDQDGQLHEAQAIESPVVSQQATADPIAQASMPNEIPSYAITEPAPPGLLESHELPILRTVNSALPAETSQGDLGAAEGTVPTDAPDHAANDIADATSGTNTPFQEFATPAAEIEDPVITGRVDSIEIPTSVAAGNNPKAEVDELDAMATPQHEAAVPLHPAVNPVVIGNATVSASSESQNDAQVADDDNANFDFHALDSIAETDHEDSGLKASDRTSESDEGRASADQPSPPSIAASPHNEIERHSSPPISDGETDAESHDVDIEQTPRALTRALDIEDDPGLSINEPLEAQQSDHQAHPLLTLGAPLVSDDHANNEAPPELTNTPPLQEYHVDPEASITQLRSVALRALGGELIAPTPETPSLADDVSTDTEMEFPFDKNDVSGDRSADSPAAESLASEASSQPVPLPAGDNEARSATTQDERMALNEPTGESTAPASRNEEAAYQVPSDAMPAVEVPQPEPDRLQSMSTQSSTASDLKEGPAQTLYTQSSAETSEEQPDYPFLANDLAVTSRRSSNGVVDEAEKSTTATSDSHLDERQDLEGEERPELTRETLPQPPA